MTIKDKIIQYLYNKTSSLEDEYNSCLHFNRFHNIDEVELLEQIVLKVRKDTANEITADMCQILQLDKKG